MIDPAAILAEFPRPVPRYTSYPTAPHFQSGLGPSLAREMLAGLDRAEPVSVYVHIPFCDRLCWFCGCHTKQTRKYEPVAAYVGTLVREIDAAGPAIGFRPRLGHLHLGGGSPSLLRRNEFSRLREVLERTFALSRETEISVEIDPSDMSDELLAGLSQLGVTRASIGVQDFDPLVQRAINRPQSFESTRDTIDALRTLGIGSINVDAVYGLPYQTRARLERTVAKVVELDPDRIALFGYAHVPWMKKHQQMIPDTSLAGPAERFEQAARAESILVAAGYAKIGIDHFARPGDALAAAAKLGTLRRNFQGYTTDRCATMLGFGASSIGSFRGGHVQNVVATGRYVAAVESGRPAAERGYRLTGDDRLRAHVIERLMCDFAFSFEALTRAFGPNAAPVVALAEQIAAGERHGLCEISDGRFVIPADATPFARIVASRFDAYLDAGAHRYSKAV